MRLRAAVVAFAVALVLLLVWGASQLAPRPAAAEPPRREAPAPGAASQPAELVASIPAEHAAAITREAVVAPPSGLRVRGFLRGEPVATCLIHAGSPSIAAVKVRDREWLTAHPAPAYATSIALCHPDALVALHEIDLDGPTDVRIELQPRKTLHVLLTNVPVGLRDVSNFAVHLSPQAFRSDLERRACLVMSEYVPQWFGDGDTTSLPLFVDGDGEAALGVIAKTGGPVATLRKQFTRSDPTVVFDLSVWQARVHVAELAIVVEFASAHATGDMWLCLHEGREVIASRQITRKAAQTRVVERIPGVPSGRYFVELQPRKAPWVRSTPFDFDARAPVDATLRVSAGATLQVVLPGVADADYADAGLLVTDATGSVVSFELARGHLGADRCMFFRNVPAGRYQAQIVCHERRVCSPMHVVTLADGEQATWTTSLLPTTEVFVDRAVVGAARYLLLEGPDGVAVRGYLGERARPSFLVPQDRYVVVIDGARHEYDWRVGAKQTFAGRR